MKILLAMLSSEPSSRFDSNANDAYPIGIGYIYSVLENVGHEVKLLVLSNHDYDVSEQRFFETFKSFNPDVVGFSVFSSNRVSTFKTIEQLNMLKTPPHIIIGGIHTSVMYEQIIKKYPNIVAVIGEGELTIIELVKALEFNLELDTIKGIAFYKNGQVILTEERELIKDLDSIPFPKHEVFFDSEPTRTRGIIFTARGCPSRCSFCCLKIISKGKYRKRNINKVLEEIKSLKQKYPRLKHIQILDDTFLLDNARVIQLCKLIIGADLGITFGCIARVKPVSSEMFYWMEKAGFIMIEFGLETGSEKLLESIHKDITQKDVINLIKILKPFNFAILFLVMCGFPGENDRTIRDSVSFIQSIQKEHYVRVFSIGKLEVFPGTEVYDIMKKAGYIDDDYWMTEKPVPYYTVEHDFQELVEYENYILDRVGIKRSFTINGFRYQLMKMPIPIIKHLLNHKEFIPHAFGWSMKLYFPRLYNIVRKIYKYLNR